MEKGFTVCLVDDEPLVLKNLEAVFKSAGFNVQTYSSAAEFLENVPASEDTAVLLDLRMPMTSGLDVLRQLKKRSIKLPVIVHTSYADVETTVQLFEEGAISLIQKPASKTLLVDKVKQSIVDFRSERRRSLESQFAREVLSLLSNREQEIAELLAKGMSAPAIANMLGLSARTIETHRQRIFFKVEVKSSAELARLMTLAQID